MTGVSIATVSRVLNNKPGVNEALRKKIQSVIDETGFRPNRLARELTNKKTNVIGVVVPGIDSFFGPRLDAINQVCSSEGYSIMITGNLCSKDWIKKEVDNLNLLYEKQVDGIIYFASKVTEKHLEILKYISKKTPIIVIDKNIDELDLPCIIQDDYHGAKKALQHLINNGHKKIAFIKGNCNDASIERTKAYMDLVKDNKIELNENYIRQGDYSIKSGYAQMSELLDTVTDIPTAVFASNDNMAIGAMKAIQERGFKIPDDISVIGFDDIEISGYVYPSLTTVKQDHHELGRQAAKTIIDIIENKCECIKKITLDQKLILRNSDKRV